MKALLLALLVFTLSACKSDLPVQYLVCDAGKERCHITAQFKDLKNCEFFRSVSSSFCDQESNPGLIICDTNRKSEKATSMCVDNLNRGGPGN